MLSKRVLLLIALAAMLPSAVFAAEIVNTQSFVTDNLSISSTGYLNMTNNVSGAVAGEDPYGIITADPYATISGYLKKGFNGGAWNGVGGIQSDTAAAAGDHSIGLITGEEWASVHPEQFHGVTPAATDLLLPYVISGDLNADGVVDDNDLGSLLGPYDPSSAGPEADYFNGDINFDGIVDDNDLGILLGPYVPAGAASAGNISPVPEPSTLVLLSIGLLSGILVSAKKRFA